MKVNAEEFESNAGFGRCFWVVWVKFWHSSAPELKGSRWEFYMGKNGTLGALALFSEPEPFKTKKSAEEWLKRAKEFFEDEIRFKVCNSGNGLVAPDKFEYRIEYCRWSMHLIPVDRTKVNSAGEGEGKGGEK